MRLTFLFLLLSMLAVYAIDLHGTPKPHAGILHWPDTVYVRMETRNGPLYYPAPPLQ